MATAEQALAQAHVLSTISLKAEKIHLARKVAQQINWKSVYFATVLSAAVAVGP